MASFQQLQLERLSEEQLKGKRRVRENAIRCLRKDTHYKSVRVLAKLAENSMSVLHLVEDALRLSSAIANNSAKMKASIEKQRKVVSELTELMNQLIIAVDLFDSERDSVSAVQRMAEPIQHLAHNPRQYWVMDI
jgi:hypothetical protein